MRKTVASSILLSCLISGCGTAVERPTAKPMSAEEMMAISSLVVDCEWKAANRYDNDSFTVSQVAEHVMGLCTVERYKVRRAFGILSTILKVNCRSLRMRSRWWRR
jgi:hypothetical protein